MDEKEKQTILLAQLVYMFHEAAMHQLGKVKSPITDKIERNLPAAQGTIDMLDMLKDKMKGNLADEEEKMMANVVRELKLNYIDEMNKPEPQPPAESKDKP